MSEFECNSINSGHCAAKGGYCKKCSHANFFGHGTINGITYHWTFSPMFGPLFTDHKHNDIEVQPDQPSPEWEAFQVWHDKRKATK